jgi:predicted nucleic acid-binding protein
VRGDLTVTSLVEGRNEEEMYLSVISASELLHGVHRASTAGIRARRSAFVEGILAELPILPVDVLVARTHARLWADLAEAGTPLGAHDLWIAATATARDLTLLTRNARDFERVPGLALDLVRES